MSPSGVIHRKIVPTLLLGLLLAISMLSPMLAVAGVALDCDGSAQAYKLQGIPCDCVNGQIVCDQSSGKSLMKSSNKSSSSSVNKTIKLQVFQSVLDAVFLGTQDSASSQEKQEAQRQQQLQRTQKELAQELERQKNYAEKKNQLLESLKGASTETLELKTNFDDATEDSKPANPVIAQEQAEFDMRNAEWVKNQRKLIEQRLKEPNKDASSIYKSIKTNAPPLPYKTFDELQPGDVLLFDGKLIAATDNALSSGASSRAAHTVLYLREINGKKYFLDNQPFQGPRIISEDDFLRLYKSRDAQLAKLAQPLNSKESEKLFSAAVEMAQKNRKEIMNNWFGSPLVETNYGTWGKENVVCSEADWALINAAGRNIPKTGDQTKIKLGIDYSPADYANSQFFLVTNFVIPK
jgi:hypothetical protein